MNIQSVNRTLISLCLAGSATCVAVVFFSFDEQIQYKAVMLWLGTMLLGSSFGIVMYFRRLDDLEGIPHNPVSDAVVHILMPAQIIAMGYISLRAAESAGRSAQATSLLFYLMVLLIFSVASQSYLKWALEDRPRQKEAEEPELNSGNLEAK